MQGPSRLIETWLPSSCSHHRHRVRTAPTSTFSWPKSAPGDQSTIWLMTLGLGLINTLSRAYGALAERPWQPRGRMLLGVMRSGPMPSTGAARHRCAMQTIRANSWRNGGVAQSGMVAEQRRRSLLGATRKPLPRFVPGPCSHRYVAPHGGGICFHHFLAWSVDRYGGILANPHSVGLFSMCLESGCSLPQKADEVMGLCVDRGQASCSVCSVHRSPPFCCSWHLRWRLSWDFWLAGRAGARRGSCGSLPGPGGTFSSSPGGGGGALPAVGSVAGARRRRLGLGRNGYGLVYAAQVHCVFVAYEQRHCQNGNGFVLGGR